MSEWIHRNDLFGISPLWERTDIHSRLGIGEVWLVIHVQLLARDCKCIVYGVRTAICPDSFLPQLVRLQNPAVIMSLPLRLLIVLGARVTMTGPLS